MSKIHHERDPCHVEETQSDAQSSPPDPYIGFADAEPSASIDLIENSTSVANDVPIGFDEKAAMHESRNRLQTSLLRLVFVVLAVVCGLLLVYAEKFSDVSGVISALLTIITTVVGALLAFYFQGRR
jgi:hypothetical protein